MPKISIRPVVKRGGEIPQELVERITEINSKAWGSTILGGRAGEIRSRLEAFPEGQLGAYIREGGSERLVGIIHMLRGNISSLEHIPSTWDHATANGTFKNHLEKGSTAYCVSVAADPAYAGMGIGSRLVTAAYMQAKKLGVKHVFAYSRFLFTQGVMGKIREHEKNIGRKITLREYNELGIDPIISRFHCREDYHKPAGTVVRILPNGRVYDTDAHGTNVIVEYTESAVRSWKRRRLIYAVKALPRKLGLIKRPKRRAVRK